MVLCERARAGAANASWALSRNAAQRQHCARCAAAAIATAAACTALRLGKQFCVCSLCRPFTLLLLARLSEQRMGQGQRC